MEMHRPVEVESSMRQSGRTGHNTYRQLYDTGNIYHFLPLPMRKRYSLTHKCYDWPVKKRDGGGACYYVDAEEKVAALHMFRSHSTWRRRAIWLRKEIVLDYTSHHKKRALFVIVCDRFSERSLSDYGISETQEAEHRGDRFKTWIKFSCDPTGYAKPLQQSSSHFVGKRDVTGD
jgi:hypothetical protein